MTEFSACYFCGTALDAPLAEYPVVPDALHPSADQQRTVVLCPTCRRKLGAVIDAVVTAVDDAPDADSRQQELDAAEDRSTLPADEETSADRREGASDTADLGSGDGRGEEADDPSTLEESTTTSTEDSGFEFHGDTDSGGDDAAVSPGASATPLDDEDSDAPSDTETASEADVTTSDDGAEETTESEDDADEDPRMTALEYNKVMRLLQNREFPVDKAEFKVVATNAYELGDDEFEAVIDAAEKRGLIGVDGGQIVGGD